MTVVSWAKSVARQIVPDAVTYSRSMRLGALNEPLLPYVLPHIDGGIAIDIGANTGVYSRAFANLTPKVVAFEPVPDMAELLRRRNPAIEVHACALGDAAGHFTLYVPHLDGRPVFSRASLHQDANPGFENRAITVQVRRLDEFEFQNVSVLKIDVEGHERSVLDGALDTIKRSKPVLVIEIEERHHPGQSWDMIRMVEGLGYAAHFADANTHALRPGAEFDFATMQNVANLKSALGAPGGMYINNFMFTPRQGQ